MFSAELWSDRHGVTERNPTLAFSIASIDPGDLPQDRLIPEYHPQISVRRRRKAEVQRAGEAEKRQRDAFRMQDRHPAASYHDLPEEVRSYIYRIEIENYDFKQERAVGGPMFASVLGAAILGVNYLGVDIQPIGLIWPYASGLLMLIAPWFLHSR